MNRTRRTITSPERDMIIRVMNYFEEEKLIGTLSLPVSNVLNRTSRATGVSVTTVKRIRREASKNPNAIGIKLPIPVKEIIIKSPCEGPSQNDCQPSKDDNIRITPVKTYSNKTKFTDDVLKGLKEIMDDYLKANGKMMSLDDTVTVAKEYLQFPVERSMLQKVLVDKLGYEFEDDYKKRKKRKGGSLSSSESDEASCDEFTEVLVKKECVNGTEVDNDDCHDPIMLCEVAIKEDFT